MSDNSVDHPGGAQPDPTGPSAVADSHEPKSASNLQSPPGKRNDLHRDLTFVDVPIEKIRIAEQRVRKPSNRQVSLGKTLNRNLWSLSFSPAGPVILDDRWPYGC